MNQEYVNFEGRQLSYRILLLTLAKILAKACSDTSDQSFLRLHKIRGRGHISHCSKIDGLNDIFLLRKQGLIVSEDSISLEHPSLVTWASRLVDNIYQSL